MTHPLIANVRWIFSLLFFCKFVKTELNKFGHLRLVVRVACLMMAVSDDAAYGACIMAKVCCDASDGRTFHLKVGNLFVAETEALKRVEHVGHSKWHAENTSLRSIES